MAKKTGMQDIRSGPHLCTSRSTVRVDQISCTRCSRIADRRKLFLSTFAVLAFSPLGTFGPAWAGELPLYRPAPEWVVPSKVDLSALPARGGLEVFDIQVRVEGGRMTIYSETASKAATPETLSQLSTVVLGWMPDKGDLIIHDFDIIRGGKVNSLLKKEGPFTVLRREEGLERRQLTGLLSATTPVEGVQLGDVVRLRYSVTMEDRALGGQVQNISQLAASPARLTFGRLKVQWDPKTKLNWKAFAAGVTPKEISRNGLREVEIALPIVKQVEAPDDAPPRFKRPPLFAMSTFASWSEVSQTMAPLYETANVVKAGGPLAEQVEIIKKAGTPLQQAQRALELVQDNIRYLALGMQGGNYVPQKPEETWALRYGDCKAKTLLLLALLHGAGIKAEAALVNSNTGDFVPELLPSVAAFDHVIVRAEIDGETVWLDGTGSGARLEDIKDVPFFRNALPVRSAGANLIPLTPRVSRPVMEFSVDADESGSVDLPTAYTAKIILRGPTAVFWKSSASQLDAQKQKELAYEFLKRTLGEGQFADIAQVLDSTDGTVTITAKGSASSKWQWLEKRKKRSVFRALDDFEFEPDRSKAAWQSIPVATPAPELVRYTLRVKLPEGGRGISVDGVQSATDSFAGQKHLRTMEIKDGVLTAEERWESTGKEIPVAEIPQERGRVDMAKSRLPKLVASSDFPRRWSLDTKTLSSSSQFRLVDEVFRKAIETREADDASPYESRASMRWGIGDFAGAVADRSQVVAIRADAQSYFQRSDAYARLGKNKEALADAQKALELDPGSVDNILSVADLMARSGNYKSAVAMLEEHAALGGDDRRTYERSKQSILGDFGDAKEAVSFVNKLLEADPNDPDLLNQKCWTQGIRQIEIDTALSVCTRAVELSENSIAALDSRALLYFRLGRMEDALNDLNTVLDADPALPESRYMRSLVYTRLGRKAEAASDMAIAQRLAPIIREYYDRFNIKP